MKNAIVFNYFFVIILGPEQETSININPGLKSLQLKALQKITYMHMKNPINIKVMHCQIQRIVVF